MKLAPAWASKRPPSLTQLKLPALKATPAFVRTVPLAVTVKPGWPPKPQTNVLASARLSHKPALLTRAELPPCSASAFQATVPWLVKATPLKALAAPALMFSWSLAGSGSGAVTPGR